MAEQVSKINPQWTLTDCWGCCFLTNIRAPCVAVTVFWVKNSWVCGQNSCWGMAGSAELEETVLISGHMAFSRRRLLFQGDKDEVNNALAAGYLHLCSNRHAKDQCSADKLLDNTSQLAICVNDLLLKEEVSSHLRNGVFRVTLQNHG